MDKNFRERVVKRVVNKATDWVIGGYENSLMDALIDKMPSREIIFKEVYEEVMSATAVNMGGMLIQVKKDIRFLGKEKIEELINARLDLEEELC